MKKGRIVVRSRKSQVDIDKEQRKTWGVDPRTRVVQDKTKYGRKKRKQSKQEVRKWTH